MGGSGMHATVPSVRPRTGTRLAGDARSFERLRDSELRCSRRSHVKSLVAKLGCWGWLTVAVLIAAEGCSRREPTAVERKASAIVGSVDPTVLLATLRARPGSPIGGPVAQTIDLAGSNLKPKFAPAAAAGESKSAKINLPVQATGAMHLEDAASGVAVDVALKD